MSFNRTEVIPNHVAIVMDGNGRWAAQRCLPRTAGHKAGLEAARRMVMACIQRKIKYLTLFTFSSENWARPKEEVTFLIKLLHHCVEEELKPLHEKKIKLRFIGDISKFPSSLQIKIKMAEENTALNEGLTVIVAINYGGRWDLVQAARRACEAVQTGEVVLEGIDDSLISRKLSTAGLPSPDLFIRTSGEMRISNFLLWQLAYTELYFTPILWPDFDEAALDAALNFYFSRERRFGHISGQLRDV